MRTQWNDSLIEVLKYEAEVDVIAAELIRDGYAPYEARTKAGERAAERDKD